jgi:hypothetical protein
MPSAQEAAIGTLYLDDRYPYPGYQYPIPMIGTLIPISGTLNIPIIGTLNIPISGTLNIPIIGTLNIPISGTLILARIGTGRHQRALRVVGVARVPDGVAVVHAEVRAQHGEHGRQRACKGGRESRDGVVRNFGADRFS